MQFWLVAGLFLVFLREGNNFDCPRHLARAQNVDYAIVLKTHLKVELLENTSVATSCDSGLKMFRKVSTLLTLMTQMNLGPRAVR